MGPARPARPVRCCPSGRPPARAGRRIREEWRCQREQRGIGACLQGAGRQQVWQGAEQPFEQQEHDARGLHAVAGPRPRRGANQRARQCGAGDQAACTPAWAARSAWAQAAPRPRQQSAQRARPASGGCRRGAGGRQASAGAGQQSFRQLGTHWWSGARSCGRAKFTPAPRRAWMPIFSRMDCVAVSGTSSAYTAMPSV